MQEILDQIRSFLYERGPALIRRLVIRYLHDRYSLGLVVEALHDDDERVRAAAVEALGQYSFQGFDRHLRRALKDPAPCVRVAALNTIRRFQLLDYASLAESRLRDHDPAVRRHAAHALERVGMEDAMEALNEIAAQDGLLSNRRSAREALQGIEERVASADVKRQKIRIELANIMLDPKVSRESRLHAKNTLMRIGGTWSASIVSEAMWRTGDVAMHVDAVELLVTLPMTEGLQSSLIDCAQHPSSPEVRRVALRELAQRGDADAIPGLEKLLLDARGEDSTYNPDDVKLTEQTIEQIQKRQNIEDSA